MISDDFYGDRFRWFVGVVKDVGDDRSRVRVRIFGIHHTEDTTKVSDGDLPWALVLYPTTGGQAGGGNASHNLTPGSWVVGFFCDGIDSQQPIVFGVINGGAESINSSPAESKSGTTVNHDSRGNVQNPSESNGTAGGGTGGGSTALLAAGTNDWGNYDQAYSGVVASAKALQAKGFTPVIVLPAQNVNGSPNAYNAASRAAADLGLQTVNPAQYGGFASDGYHINPSTADAIKKQYPDAQVFGDSNAVRLGAKEGVTGNTGAHGSEIAKNIEKSDAKPSNTDAPSTTQLSGGTNVQKVYNYFWEKIKQEGSYSGDLKCIVSAIVGNLQQESGVNINPQAYNPSDKGELSAGIAQWRAGRYDRYTPFLKFCGINSPVKPPNLPPLEKQLDFMWHELHTSERSAYNKLIPSTTIQDAVAGIIAFERDESWIRGTVDRNNRSYKAKLSYARQILSSVSYTGGASS
jgi:hypothetical protein